MELINAIDIFDEPYTDEKVVASDITRKYGMSPDKIIEERERRISVVHDLEIIASVLSAEQNRILALIGAGFNNKQIAEELGIVDTNMATLRRGIPKRLDKEVDEERIQYVAAEVVRLAGTARGRHSKLYSELCTELDRRLAVREALKRLFVNLTPPSSKKEADGGMSMPAYTFERVMAMGEGMREGISEGRKVMKTIVKCRMPEYMAETFGDKCTCCTLCPTCKRKNDVEGRRGYSRCGLEKK